MCVNVFSCAPQKPVMAAKGMDVTEVDKAKHSWPHMQCQRFLPEYGNVSLYELDVKL